MLFVDEPTGALDSTAADGILRLLTGVRAHGGTLVVVTHGPRVAAHAEPVGPR